MIAVETPDACGPHTNPNPNTSPASPATPTTATRTHPCSINDQRLTPDFVTLELNATVPHFPLVGGSIQVSVDRFGNWYIGPGVTVGRSLSVVAGSVVAGTILAGDNASSGGTVSPGETNSFLTGGSVTVTPFFLLFGLSSTTSGGRETSEFGVGSPQIGLSGHWGISIGSTPGIAWSPPCR